MAGWFAQRGRAQALPPSSAGPGGLYSVPRPSGGYDYYQAPAGTAPPLNDDFPVPLLPHPNRVGVSSLSIGRPLPPGSVHVGSGDVARGSVTAMPGVRADGPLTSGLGSPEGLGASLVDPSSPNRLSQTGQAAFLGGVALTTAAVVLWMRKKKR